MNRRLGIGLFLVLLGALPVNADDWPTMVAVLPELNYSMDAASGNLLRDAFIEELPRYGYSLVRPELVEEACRERGIVHGGDLKLVDPVELGRELKARYLLVPSLEASDKAFKGLVNARYSSIMVRLIDTGNGAVVYQRRERFAKRNFNVDPVNMVISIAETAASRQERVIERLVRKVLQDIPGPLEGGDPLLEGAEEL